MQRIFASIILLYGLFSSVYAEQFVLIPNISNTPITSFNLGGGGNVVGHNISSNGVRFLHGDGWGTYIYGDDNKWHLIDGETNLCPGSLGGYPCLYFGLNPTNTSNNQVYVGFGGSIDIQGCPSLSSCAYLNSGGWLFYSANIDKHNWKNITWCPTNFPQTINNANSAVGLNNPGPIMAIDPINPDHILIGTSASGIFESFNATSCGSSTFTAISTANIPLASGYAGYIPVFDPTSPTATCSNGSGTCTSTVYIVTNGAPAGVYATFNAGVSWALTASSPTTTIRHLKISAASAGGGNLWAAVKAGGDIWEYNNASGAACSLGGCSWSNNASLSTANASDVTVNPFDGTQIAVSAQGTLYVSSNGTSATPTFVSFTGTPVAGDTPWALQTNAVQKFFGINGIDFDPVNNGTILGHGVQWEWVTTFPSGPFNWAIASSGLSGAVSLGNIVVGAPQTPTFGFEDVIACTMSIPTAATPPSVCALPNALTFTSAGLFMYSGLSIAPGTTFMAAKGSADFGTGFDLSGYTTDGFRTTYTPYNTWITSVDSGTGVSSGTASAVRLNVGTTSTLNTFVPGHTLANKSIACIVTPYSNSGLANQCWPINVVNGTQIELIGSVFSSTMALAGNTYTVFVPAAPLDDQFGFGAIQNVVASGGLVRVTFKNAFGWTPTRGIVCITGVVMTGATVVNGCWPATAIANNPPALTLASSVFVGGDTYSTGGIAFTVMAPGGSIAVSTPSNFVMYGTDNTAAYCTDDAGANWNQVNSNIPGVPSAVTTVTGGPYAAATSQIFLASTSPNTVTANPVLLLNSGRYLNETSSAPQVKFTASITSNVMNVTAVTAGTGVIVTGQLNIGGIISGTGITIGTTIASLGTGTGGIGTYNLSTTPDVASRAMTQDGIMTLKIPIPPGDSLATGSSVYGSTSLGGPFAVFFRTHQIAADQVIPNKFYYMNAVAGLVSWTHCGTPVIVTPRASITPGPPAALSDQVKTVPGQAGHLFFDNGAVGNPRTFNFAGDIHPGPAALFRACNGVNSTANSVTLNTVPGFFEPRAIGFGKPYPGGASFSGTISGTTLTAGPVSGVVQIDVGATFTGIGVTAGTKVIALGTGIGNNGTYIVNNSQNVGPIAMITQANNYPSIYVASWYSSTLNNNTATYGIYRSIDDLNNGSTSATCDTSNTWQEITGTNGWPANYFGNIVDIEGDPFVFGPFYIENGAVGYFYGVQNFLLKRDLDPTANDNSPVFLNIAA